MDLESDGNAEAAEARRPVRARLLRAAATVALSAGVAWGSFALASRLPPQFRAEAKLLVETRPPEFAAGSPADRAVIERDLVDAQVQLIGARDVARRVVQARRLADDPVFQRSPGSLLEGLLASAGLAGDPDRISPEERAIDRFLERLDVRAVPGTRIVRVAVTAADPDLARSLTEAVTGEYLGLQAEGRRAEAMEEAKHIGEEVERLARALRRAEDALAAARSRPAPTQSSEAAALSLGLADLTASAAGAEAEHLSARLRADELRRRVASARDDAALANAVSTPAMQALRARAVEVSGRLSALLGAVSANDPRVTAVMAERADVLREQRAEARRAVDELDGAARVAKARADALAAALARARALPTPAAAAAPGAEIARLEGEANRAREALTTAAARYRALAARQTETVPEAAARIVARASAPGRAVFPRPWAIATAAGLAALSLGLLWIVAAEWVARRRRIRPAGALSKPRALAGLTPEAAPPPARAEETLDSRVARFRSMVEQAAHRRRDLEPPAPAPVEPVHQPGLVQGDVAALHATLIADGSGRVALMTVEDEDALEPVVAELSRTATEDGTRVVVVDTIASHAGRGGPGLSDLVAGQATFGEIIQRNRLTRAHEIGVGSAPLDPALLDVDVLETMLSALESAYDLVLLSLGDMEADSVRFRLVAAADHAVLVGAPDDPRIARACRVLLASGMDQVSIMPPAGRPGLGAAA